MATSCSSTCGGVKKAVAQVRESIRFCRASERGMASGSCDPAHPPSTGAYALIRCQTQTLTQS